MENSFMVDQLPAPALIRSPSPVSLGILRYSTEWSANIDGHRGYQLEFQLADVSVWCSRELLDSVKGKAFQRFRYSLMGINVWQFRRWALDPDRRGPPLEVSRGFSRCYAIWLSLQKVIRLSGSRVTDYRRFTSLFSNLFSDNHFELYLCIWVNWTLAGDSPVETLQWRVTFNRCRALGKRLLIWKVFQFEFRRLWSAMNSNPNIGFQIVKLPICLNQITRWTARQPDTRSLGFLLTNFDIIGERLLWQTKKTPLNGIDSRSGRLRY